MRIQTSYRSRIFLRASSRSDYDKVRSIYQHIRTIKSREIRLLRIMMDLTPLHHVLWSAMYLDFAPYLPVPLLRTIKNQHLPEHQRIDAMNLFRHNILTTPENVSNWIREIYARANSTIQQISNARDRIEISNHLMDLQALLLLAKATAQIWADKHHLHANFLLPAVCYDEAMRTSEWVRTLQENCHITATAKDNLLQASSLSIQGMHAITGAKKGNEP